MSKVERCLTAARRLKVPPPREITVLGPMRIDATRKARVDNMSNNMIDFFPMLAANKCTSSQRGVMCDVLPMMRAVHTVSFGDIFSVLWVFRAPWVEVSAR